MRKLRFALICLAVMLITAAAPALARSLPDDGSTRVISITTRAGDIVHERLTLSLSKATIVALDTDARDVLVSDPSIVDAVVRTPRRIYLMAQKIGQTNAFFFDATGRQILSLDIRVERDVTDLMTLFKTDLPGSDIKISAMNDSLVLSGTVTSTVQSSRAQDIAARFTGDPSKVVNLLQIAGGQQVMLKVRIAEMQRQIAKQFGVNLTGAGLAGGVPISVSTYNPYGLMGEALSNLSGGQIGSACAGAFNPSTSGTTTTTIINNTSNNSSLLAAGLASGVSTVLTKAIPCTSPNNIQGTFQALETVGLVHILAEPNLVAVSGETAKFLAGGEFPVPSGRDLQGNVSITFKDFGVGLSFTPVVLSSGRISLQLSTEVSELTNTGAFTLQGTSTTQALTIPALDVRRAETTVELPSGGSFAIAGLIEHITKQQIDAFPGLKDMPVLGALFRSRDFQNDETELVVLVTAYLVNPTQEDKLAAPTDGFKPPTDPETILLGRLNAISDHDKTPAKVPEGGSGFIVQ
jgi:pilus assembly protein CpaC